MKTVIFLKNLMLNLLLIISIIAMTTSCKSDVEGCTDPSSLNYNPDADIDNGSCMYTEGCTDPNSLNYNPDAVTDDGSCLYLRDKVIGDWEVVKFFFDDEDFIGLGIFNSITFEFEADGDFEWKGVPASGSAFFGSGDWAVDGDFLEIELNSGSDTFCGDGDHRFSLDFDGDDELNLEDRCNDNTNLKIELDKS